MENIFVLHKSNNFYYVKNSRARGYSVRIRYGFVIDHSCVKNETKRERLIKQKSGFLKKKNKTLLLTSKRERAFASKFAHSPLSCYAKGRDHEVATISPLNFRLVKLFPFFSAALPPQIRVLARQFTSVVDSLS